LQPSAKIKTGNQNTMTHIQQWQSASERQSDTSIMGEECFSDYAGTG
jgi:hypothetical protein